jgi:hypothetical protein
MNPIIEKEFRQLETELEKIVREIESHDDDTLNTKPPNSWSVLQVFHHLILAEKGSLAYVKKKLSYNPKLEKTNWKTGIRTYLLDVYVWSPIKFKAPKNISQENLPEKSTLQEVKTAYAPVRKEMKEFLENLPDDLLDKEIYKHPFAGRLSIKGMVQFFRGHQKRHSNQIRKILQSVAKQ